MKMLIMKMFREERGESIYIHDGDILMFLRDDGKLQCWGCQLRRRGIFGCYKHTKLKNKEEALEHLRKHIKAGHNVPEYAINRLRIEVTGSTREIANERYGGWRYYDRTR